MLKLTDDFYLGIASKGDWSIEMWLQYAIDNINRDYIMGLSVYYF